LSQPQSIELDIVLEDVNPLEVFGLRNEKLEMIKEAYPSVKFVARGNTLKTLGDLDTLEAVQELIRNIIAEIHRYGGLDSVRLRDLLDARAAEALEPNGPGSEDVLARTLDGKPIKAKTPGQRNIVAAARKNDVVFAVGPAGTGKTYVAVALAVEALKKRQVKKIILTRPAVEAGEQLGFLPGDLKEKVDPFLRPLYDALEDMIPAEKLKGYMEKNVIEIAPLAYMRGRTLNSAFIILDEAQNATRGQMKMFLTRLGQDSKIIVTGDISQIDLPRKSDSGLLHANRILQGVKGIGFATLSGRDVVRHPIVVRILEAYETDDEATARELERRTVYAPTPTPPPAG
jgi:phosphate starvation-inducible PhoH-like protein